MPRKTQYDHPVYMRMIGSRNKVPISRNPCDFDDDDAAHSVTVYGTTIGQMLIPSPSSLSDLRSAIFG